MLNAYGVPSTSALIVTWQVGGVPLQVLAATVTGETPPSEADTV